MYGDVARQVRAVFDRHVTADHRIVDKDGVVANDAIMGDVGADHQQVVVPDSRRGASMQGTMNGRAFADGVARADRYRADFGRHARMLGQSAERRTFKNVVVAAKRGALLDDRVGVDRAAVADDDSLLDDRERSHLDVASQQCRGMDHGQGVNGHLSDSPFGFVVARNERFRGPLAEDSHGRAPV